MGGHAHEPSREDTDVLGGRMMAQILDLILMFWGWFAFSAIGKLLSGNGGSMVTELGFLLGVGVAAGYPIVLEAVWDGRTVGKRAFGIKAVEERGDSVGVGSALIRNLPALAPFFFFALPYLVALLSIAESDKRQRLFDRLAGTVVVEEPTGSDHHETPEPAPREGSARRETSERAGQSP